MNEQIVKAGRLARVAEFLQWPCEVTAFLNGHPPGPSVDGMPQQD